MTKPAPYWIAAVGCACLALSVSAAVADSHDTANVPVSGSLIEKAQRVFVLPTPSPMAEMSYWGEQLPQIEQPWLSDHELLYVDRGGGLSRYDLATKRQFPLVALTKVIAKLPVFSPPLYASPAGGWILCSAGNSNTTYAVPVDGSRLIKFPTAGIGEAIWCGDGRHWLWLLYGRSSAWHMTIGGISVYDVDRPTTSVQITNIPKGFAPLEVLAAPSPKQIVVRVPDKTVITPEGKINALIKDINRAEQSISVWSMSPPRRLNQYHIRLPGDVTEVSVTATGDRIAWVLLRWPKTEDPTPTALTETVWVSKVDGSSLREMGDFRATLSSRDRAYLAHPGLPVDPSIGRDLDYPRQISWLPGGRHLGFVYDGAMWTVPAE